MIGFHSDQKNLKSKSTPKLLLLLMSGDFLKLFLGCYICTLPCDSMKFYWKIEYVCCWKNPRLASYLHVSTFNVVLLYILKHLHTCHCCCENSSVCSFPQTKRSRGWHIFAIKNVTEIAEMLQACNLFPSFGTHVNMFSLDLKE